MDIDENPAAAKAAEEPHSDRSVPVLRDEHTDPPLTRVLEQQTGKIPSHWFLAAALGAMAVSAGLELTGRRRLSKFVGLWPASLLTLGVYNKLVKLFGPG
jgi:hypothetical protein